MNKEATAMPYMEAKVKLIKIVRNTNKLYPKSNPNITLVASPTMPMAITTAWIVFENVPLNLANKINTCMCCFGVNNINYSAIKEPLQHHNNPSTRHRE